MSTSHAVRLRAAAQEMATCSDNDFEDASMRMRYLLHEPAQDLSACVESEAQTLRDVRWEATFSVDAETTNDCIRHQYVSRERDARQRIVDFMQANDMHLPALAVCQGVSYYPDTKRLAAFTNDRFFRALAAGNRCPLSEEDSGLCVPASEAAGTEALFQIVENEAPSSLTLPQMIELVAVTKYYMADAVVAAFPQYLGLAMQQMNAHELAWLLGELFVHLADRQDYHEHFVAFVQRAVRSPGIAASGKSFHAFATHTIGSMAAAQPVAADGVVTLLALTAQSDALPSHARLLYAIALVAVAQRGADSDGAAMQRAHEVMRGVFLATCGQQCQHSAVLSDLLVDVCTSSALEQTGSCALLSSSDSGGCGSNEALQLLKLSHRLLLDSHCTGVSWQRLQLAPLGQPVVFGKTADREMFVTRLQLPCANTRAVETAATTSGWWLKVERCDSSKGADEVTYSLFLNNSNASSATPLQAAFEIGVLASGAEAMRKAEAAAVLIEHSGFMRQGLWAANEASIHRSAIRQEFSGAAWGIRHLCNNVALARFGYDVASGPAVNVFGMVQTS